MSLQHHCRKCGLVVCGSCSNKRWLLPEQSSKPLRVCLSCFDKLSAAATGAASNAGKKAQLQGKYTMAFLFWSSYVDREVSCYFPGLNSNPGSQDSSGEDSSDDDDQPNNSGSSQQVGDDTWPDWTLRREMVDLMKWLVMWMFNIHWQPTFYQAGKK